MKIKYDSPELRLDYFSGSIVTASGTTDGVDLTENALENFGIIKIEKAALEQFEFKE